MKFRNCKKFRYGIPAHFEPCLCFVTLTLISNNPFRILCPLSCPSQRDPYKSPNLSLRCGRGAKFKYWTAWVVTRRSVARFSPQRSDSCTGQCISDVWWTNWQWNKFLSEFFGFVSVSIIPPLAPYSLIHHVGKSGPAPQRHSLTQSQQCQQLATC
jgi:hypothetical protein